MYDRYKDNLAAVMVEPAGAMLDDLQGLAGEADADFLQIVADATRRAGALLIFDEIITGFRYRHGSVQKATGVVPDLTCLGKALASGMPLAALLGPYRVFLPNFEKTHFHPTFRSEAYSLAAARAAIEIYRTQPVVDHIGVTASRCEAASTASAAILEWLVSAPDRRSACCSYFGIQTRCGDRRSARC